MNNGEVLLRDIEKKIEGWNERSSFTLKGVRNLSMSDLESLKLYALQYIKMGEVTGNGLLIKPRGEVAEVLQAYEML